MAKKFTNFQLNLLTSLSPSLPLPFSLLPSFQHFYILFCSRFLVDRVWLSFISQKFPILGLVGVSQASDKSRFAALFSNKKKIQKIQNFHSEIFSDVLDFKNSFISLLQVESNYFWAIFASICCKKNIFRLFLFY